MVWTLHLRKQTTGHASLKLGFAYFQIVWQFMKSGTRYWLLIVFQGVQVHDARLLATMNVHSVKQILTFNTMDFMRYTNIESLLPQDVLAAS